MKTPARAPLPPDPRIAYQGEPGAFSECALRRLCGARARPVPRRTLAAAVAAVACGSADAVVLPLRNSLAGEVPGVRALLRRFGLAVVAETTLPIRQCLIAPPGVRFAAIRCVLSHPVALAQCRRFLARHPHLRAVAVHDTAGAVRLALARADAAAIAGAAAAREHGARVLRRGLADRRDNRTRFALLVPRPSRGVRDRFTAPTPASPPSRRSAGASQS